MYYSYGANFIISFTEVSPQLLYKFIEQTMQPGPSVSLKCSASGNPTPKIVWQLDGFPLPNVNILLIYIIKHQYVSSNNIKTDIESL